MRTQQEKVYAAERAVTAHGDTFDSQPEIQAWVDELIDQPWWHERFPNVLNVEVPTVKRGREGSVGSWDAYTEYGIVEMAPCHWNQRDVLHELSHVCADSMGAHGHDPLFVRTFCELVYRVLGTELWLALRQSMINHDVVIDEREDER